MWGCVSSFACLVRCTSLGLGLILCQPTELAFASCRSARASSMQRVSRSPGRSWSALAPQAAPFCYSDRHPQGRTLDMLVQVTRCNTLARSLVLILPPALLKLLQYAVNTNALCIRFRGKALFSKVQNETLPPLLKLQYDVIFTSSQPSLQVLLCASLIFTQHSMTVIPVVKIFPYYWRTNIATTWIKTGAILRMVKNKNTRSKSKVRPTMNIPVFIVRTFWFVSAAIQFPYQPYPTYTEIVKFFLL